MAKKGPIGTAKSAKKRHDSQVAHHAAKPGVCWQLTRCGLLFLTVLATYTLYLVNLAGEFRSLTAYGMDGCVKVSVPWPDRAGLAVGFEDLDTWGPGAGLGAGLAIASAEDRRASMPIMKVSNITRAERLRISPPGAMYVMRNASALQHLPILDGWVAKNPGFHPHGVSALATADHRALAAVVNHAPDGERVELFELVRGAGGQQLALRHLQTVRDHALFRGLNDVVLVDENEFYVTNWHYFPMGTLMATAEMLLRLPLNYVVRCTAPPGASMQCQSILAGFRQANGLAAFGDYVYLADPLDAAMYVMRRDPATGALHQLARIDHVGCDNVWTDGQRILTACHPRLFTFVGHSANPAKHAPSQVMELTARTGPTGATEWALKELFMDPVGDFFSASSFAAFFGGRMLIGGVFDEGIVSCPIPK